MSKRGLVVLWTLLQASPGLAEVPTTTAPAADKADASSVRAINPHWSADGCHHCHKMKNGKALPIAPTDVDALCLDCHDGKRASKESHPIGRGFAGEQIVQPEGWPAVKGQLGCGTCHRIVEPCRSAGTKPRRNPSFLRDYDASNPSRFCSRCHLGGKEHERYNPHLMLTKDNDLRTQSCRFCHTTLFDQRDRLQRMGEPALRTDPITLCVSCHTQHIDFFEPGHIGAKVPEDMTALMLSFEKRRLGKSSRLGTGREPVLLPLTDGDTVVCSTCHNPHQFRLFRPESVLSFGEMRPSEKGGPLRLRGLGKEVCIACHGK